MDPIFTDDYIKRKIERIKTALYCCGVEGLSDNDLLALALDSLERELIAQFFNAKEGENGGKLES